MEPVVTVLENPTGSANRTPNPGSEQGPWGLDLSLQRKFLVLRKGQLVASASTKTMTSIPFLA